LVDPVYTYSYQQAVLDGYLVDHDAPIIIQTRTWLREGIHFKKGAEVDIFLIRKRRPSIKKSLPDNMDFEL
jgi:type I restriction enzyme R subunit